MTRLTRAALGRGDKLVRLAGARIDRRLRFGGRFVLDDRRRDRSRLVVISAGFKPRLWPFTLERLARFAPEDADVCLASAGMRSPELARLAEEQGWSYLSSANARVAAPINLAIREHPAAEWIAKVDEDIVVAEGWFDALLDGYQRVRDEGIHDPGFVAPVLNLNGFAYRRFLLTLGLLDEFEREFGRARSVCFDLPVYQDGKAAEWIWRRSLPFDEVAARFAAEPFGYTPIHHRFTIGAILLRRELWEGLGGFHVAPQPPGIAAEEGDLCERCMDWSRAMILLHNVFAGHFSFRPQAAAMEAVLPDLAPGLVVAERVPAS